MARDKDEKYGEPSKFDPNFKGPIHNRSCTDIICCVLFLICFLGMIVVGLWSFTKGDPSRLLYPTDGQGRLCGFGDKSDRPYVFFFDLVECGRLGPAALLANGCPTPQICVEECPKENFVYLSYLTDEQTTRDKMDPYCKYGVDAKDYNKSVEKLVEDEDCAAYYTKSTSVLGRCLPSIFTDSLQEIGKQAVLAEDGETELKTKDGQHVTFNELKDGSSAVTILLNAREYGVQVYQDVRATWWMILIGLTLAMLLSLIWIILMRWIAFPMVWLTILAFLGLFGVAAGYSFYKYFKMTGDPEHEVEDIAVVADLDYYTNLADTWLVLGIIAGVFFLIVLIVILFLRTRILIAIELIKESSKAIGSMLFTLVWPVVPFLLQLCLFAYWGASALFLASLGNPEYRNGTTNGSNTDGYFELGDELTKEFPCDDNDEACQFFKYGGDEYTIYLQAFMLFMLFWVMNFIIALGQMTLAGAFASYYWAFRKPHDIPAFPVSGGFYRSLRYHMGTLAFGALIIAIIQMIRVTLEYIESKLKGSEFAPAKFLIKCLKCCFWCLEKIIKFINKNAYILTAIYGYNFCTAARKAFMLIMRNIIRVAVVDKVTDFLVFIGKLMVVGAIAVAAYMYFDGELEEISDIVEIPQLNFMLVPVIVISIGAYVIASGFFNVYSMGVDTLFLCFLEDLERNDGTAEKPYYMNKSLMQLMGKKNTKEVEDARRK